MVELEYTSDLSSDAERIESSSLSTPTFNLFFRSVVVAHKNLSLERLGPNPSGRNICRGLLAKLRNGNSERLAKNGCKDKLILLPQMSESEFDSSPSVLYSIMEEKFIVLVLDGF